MYCKECGKEIPDDSKFCKSCGKMVEEVEVEEHKATTSEKVLTGAVVGVAATSGLIWLLEGLAIILPLGILLFACAG